MRDAFSVPFILSCMRWLCSKYSTQSEGIIEVMWLLFYFIFINFAKQQDIQHRKKSVHVFTDLSTGGDTATASANYFGPRTQIDKCKTNNTIYKQQTMFRPNLWAALQVKHIDLKDLGSSGK